MDVNEDIMTTTELINFLIIENERLKQELDKLKEPLLPLDTLINFEETKIKEGT